MRPWPRHRLQAPVATAAGAACLLLAAAAGLAQDARTLAAAWLAAWWCTAGLPLGACSMLWLHALTGGRWGAVLRPAAACLALRRAWLLPLTLPLAWALPLLYPWAGPARDAAFAGLQQPGFARLWLSWPVFDLRMLVYGVAVAWLLRSAVLPRLTRRRAALSMLVFALAGSLAVADLLMSLLPGWRSTGFALLVLAGQSLGGAAALVAWSARHLPERLAAPADDAPPPGRDLGNLLLMLAMLWGYLGFMHYLIIWAENLPAEITWFVPRVQTGWWYVGFALVALQLAVPACALLWRRVKDRPRSLLAVALLLLAAHALEGVWLVLPSVVPRALAAWWLAPLCMAGMGLLLYGPMLAPPLRAARRPGPAQAEPAMAMAEGAGATR